MLRYSRYSSPCYAFKPILQIRRSETNFQLIQLLRFNHCRPGFPPTATAFRFAGAMNISGSLLRFRIIFAICGLALREPLLLPGRVIASPKVFLTLTGLRSSRREAEGSSDGARGVDGLSTEITGMSLSAKSFLGKADSSVLDGIGFPELRARRRDSLSSICCCVTEGRAEGPDVTFDGEDVDMSIRCDPVGGRGVGLSGLRCGLCCVLKSSTNCAGARVTVVAVLFR